MIFSQKLILNLSSSSERSSHSHHTPSADISIPGKRSRSNTKSATPPFSSMFPSKRGGPSDEMELGGIRVDKDVEISVDALDTQESIISNKGKVNWDE
jgi:hypothetical protein